jgi:hypothetical protein
VNDDDDSFAPDFFELVLLGLVILAAVVALGTCVTKARAQEPGARRGPTVEEVVTISRVCMNEVDGVEPSDCEAIIAVLRSRSARTGTSLVGMARAYADSVFDPARTGRRAFINQLDHRARKPPSFPAHLSWSRYRARWLALMAHVAAILRDGKHSCEAEVDHWGMRSGPDWERAVAAGWLLVGCGPTRNAFWRVPRG